MMRECMEIVRARLDEGMDADAIVAAGLPEKFASWSWRFIDTERWLRSLARGLGGER